MKNEYLVSLLIATVALLMSCTMAKGEATRTVASTDAAHVPLVDSTPYPSPVPGLQLSPAAPATSLPLVSAIPSTATTAESRKPGWTRHISINQVQDVAFSPDGTLWAATSGGLVHWDPTDDTYIRYQLVARAIAAAPDGTLWVAIEGGLCHFTPAPRGPDSGGSCRNYTTEDGLIDNAIRAVAVGDDQVVWVGAETGVSRFDGRSWSNYPSSAPTADLALAPTGEVWHATPLGIGRYIAQEDAWETYGLESGLPDTDVQLVAAGPDGQVWAYIAWNGIYRLDDRGVDGDERWLPVDEPPGGLVGAISFSTDGTPWVATVGSLHFRGGALAFHDGLRWVDTTADSAFTPLRALAPGPAGQVAASTSQGLAIYEHDQWRLLRDGPAQDGATAVAVTPDGSVWFAFGDSSTSSHGGGLSRYSLSPSGEGNAGNWNYHLGDTEVNTLAVAPDGSLWVANENAILRFSNTTWQTVAECTGHRDCGVLDLAFSADGSLWAANGFSVARLSSPAGSPGDASSWTRYDRMVHALVAAPDGTVWMNGWEGTLGSQYVARTDGENWTVFGSADAFPGAFAVEAITEDGRVWGVVPTMGLASFNGAAGAAFSQHSDDTRSRDVVASWSDSEAWRIFAAPEGLSPLSIEALAPDGALWLATDGGIGRFDPAIAESVAPERVAEQAWTLYGWDEGVMNRPSPMAFGLDAEDLWIGTTRFESRETVRRQPFTPARARSPDIRNAVNPPH